MIKAQAINEFKLPFRMHFGKFGKISLNIPWKQNFSVPTEITLENVEIVLSMLKQSEWEFLDLISAKAKMKTLLKFASNKLDKLRLMMNKSEKKEDTKEKKDDSSFVDKILIKILDNLHVSFKHVNVRIEDIEHESNFSLGITLEELFIINTNEQWKQEFIDRNDKANMTRNIYKLLKLSNFGLYLKCNDTLNLSSKSKEEIEKEMKILFPEGAQKIENIEYLINPITLTGKMKQINDPKGISTESDNENITIIDNIDETNKENNARINLMITLSKFDITIQKEQFDSIIKLLNEVSNYQQFQYNYYITSKYRFFRPKEKIKEAKIAWWQYAIRMTVKQIQFHKGKKDVYKIPERTNKKYENTFKQLFPKYYLNKEKFPEKEKKILDDIVEKVDIKEMYLWMKPCFTAIYEEEKKKKETENFFSKFLKKEVKLNLSEEEKNQLEVIVDKVINEEMLILSNTDIETKIKFILILEEGSFKFSKTFKSKNDNGITEGISINYNHLFISMRQGEFFSFLDSQLTSFNISMFTLINNNITTIPITYNTKTPSFSSSLLQDNNDDFFLKLSYHKKNPNEDVNSILSLQVNTLNIIYNQSLIERVIFFFTFKVEEHLANIAMGKYSSFKETTQKSLKEHFNKKNIVDIVIQPRSILVPINKYDIRNSKLLNFELGLITIKSNQKLIENYSDVYSAVIDNLGFYFYQNIKDVGIVDKSFPVLRKANATIDIAMNGENKNANMKAFVEINGVTFSINEYLFAVFIFLTDILTPTKNNDIWSQLNTNKEEIKSNAKNIIKLYKKNTMYFTWEEYHAVLSNGYLYFYSAIEDEDYQGYFFLRDMEIEHFDGFVVVLKNKLGSIELMFNSEEELNSWEQCVLDRINEMNIPDIYNENEEEEKEKIKEDNKDPDKIVMNVQLHFSDIHGSFYVKDVESFSAYVSDIAINANITDLDYEIHVMIRDAVVNDLLETNAKFSTIASPMKNEDSNIPLIDVVVLICDEKSKKYKNIQFDINVIIKKLIVFWHPNTIRRMFSAIVHNDILKHNIALEIFNNDIQNRTFIKATPIKQLQQKCTEYTFTYINMCVHFEKINFTWIQPILNIPFSKIILDQTEINAVLKVDHYKIFGSLGNTTIYDLTNYPYGYSQEENEHIIKEIFGKEGNDSNSAMIQFEYLSMYPFCPLSKNNYLSEVKVIIESVYLLYMHEHFLRCFNYFISEFLGSLSAPDEVKQFQNEQYNISKHEKDIDFMNLDVLIKSPKMYVKPRYGAEDVKFIINSESIHLSCDYDKVFGKVREKADEYRWLTTYQFELNKIRIKTEDSFDICKEFDGIININLTEYTESDKLWLDQFEFDYSYQFDLYVNEAEINLRQKDFTNFMKCVDLNVTYTDEKDALYDYEMNKLNLKKMKTNNPQHQKENIRTEKEILKLKELYYDIYAHILVGKIKMNLFLENEKKFSEFVINEMAVNVERKLNFNKYVNVSIQRMDAYHINELDQSIKQNILSNISSSSKEIETIFKGLIETYILQKKVIIKESFNKISILDNQCEIKISLFANYEKSIKFSINGFKLIFRYDTLNLLRYFFIEGLPFYHSTSKDLPNDFDPNEENAPPLSFVLDIKRPLICLLSDTLSNKDQHMLCLTSEVIIGMKSDKISQVKDNLLKSNKINESGFISQINISLFDVCPFIIKMNELDTVIHSIFGKKVKKSKLRMITDTFELSFENKTEIDILDNITSRTGTHTSSSNSTFMMKSITKLNVNRITLKTSYRDIVLLANTVKYNLEIMSSSFNSNIESLKSFSKAKGSSLLIGEGIIDNGIANMTLNSQGIQIILIDDHANTFYPFISLSINELYIAYDALNNNALMLSSSFLTKVHCYNYIAGGWEPIIEKSKFDIDVSREKNETESVMAIHIKCNDIMNINLSDLSLGFLIKTLSNWFDKLQQVKENKYICTNDNNMKITNHTVVNYTGHDIKLYRIASDSSRHLLSKVKPNESYEIEYFINSSENDFMSGLTQEKFISFEVENLPIKNNTLKIDSIQSKLHYIDSSKFHSNTTDVIISRISLKKLKKFIYFYSSLSFKNKTNFIIGFNLYKKGLPLLRVTLSKKETFGIPYEYLQEGTFQLSINKKSGKVYQLSSFLQDKEIIEEINFDGVYINLYHPKGGKYLNKTVRIRMSYTMMNCLPFEIQVVMKDVNEMHVIKKNEKVDISSISRHKNLKCFLYFYNFHTKKEVTLVNLKENKTLIQIELENNERQSIIIYATIIICDSVMVVFHSSSVLLNHTDLALKFWSIKKDQYIPIPNQIKNYNFFLLNDEKNIMISYKNYQSKKIPINAIGTTSIVELSNYNDKNQKIEFIMDISLSLLHYELNLYTTMITLLPRIIIYNKLDYKIRIAIESEEIADVQSDNKYGMYYYGDKLIRFKLGNDEWDYSSPISLVNVSYCTLKCNNLKQKKKNFYINVEKKLDNLSTYIILTKSEINSTQIVIENYSNSFDLNLYQFGYKEDGIYLRHKSKSIFAFNNIFTNTAVSLQFLTSSLIIDENNEKTFDLLDEKIYSREQGKEFTYPHSEIVYINTGLFAGYKLKIIFYSDGRRYTIQVRDCVEKDSLQLLLEDGNEIEINLYFEKIGLSIIGDNKNLEKGDKEVKEYNRKEICYVEFDKVLMYNKRKRINNNTAIQNEIQFVVKDIEIDNEISYIRQFPIVLVPYNRKNKVQSKDEQKTKNSRQSMHSLNTSSSITTNNANSEIDNPFINFAMSTETGVIDSKITKINILNYLIQSFILNIESNVLVGIINFIQNLSSELRTSFTKINPIFLSQDLIPKNITIMENFYKPPWLDQISISNSQNIVISHLSTSSLEIHLTFINQTKDKIFAKILQSNRIISSLLSTISNIEGVHIKLNGCELINFTGEWSELIKSIMINYQQNILIKLLKLFGAVDIIGDPLNLISSLGKGFKDFFSKPAKGMMKGPLQGAIGLVDGTLSLAKHTFDGTMNSTSKLTSGISKSMLLLTQDDEYINRRERRKITQKPKNVLEGIGYGLSSMAGGIFYGVTDIVKKPFEGAKKEKVKGFGKGLLKGLSGVVIKPISGVFDLVSKTTEGIKNTVKNEEDCKPIRIPRAFYGKYKIIKGYNLVHAQVMMMLITQIDSLKGKKFDFYNCEIYKNSKNDQILLCFLSKGIFTIDLIRKELKSIIEYQNIKDISLDDGGKIIILFNKSIEKKMFTSINVCHMTCDPKKIVEKIKSAIESSYEELGSLD